MPSKSVFKSNVTELKVSAAKLPNPVAAGAISQFILGLTTPLRAVALILFDPRLLTLSALPILLSCVFLAITFYALMAGAYTWLLHWFTIFSNGWMAQFSEVVHFLISLIIIVVFILFSTNLVMILTTFIASPLNDFLAEATEGALHEPKIKKSFFYLLKVFFLDLRKTIFTLIFTIFFGLGLLLPGVGMVFFLGVALLNTFTFVTYSQSRRAHGFRDSLRWIFQNFWLALGFGITTTALFSVPPFNLFAIPLSVVGGTMLFLNRDRVGADL
jgi:CysZ protein